jgi:hypothetical protein
MSPGVLVLTIVLLVVPVAFLVAILTGQKEMEAPFIISCAVYGWVWLGFRPSTFILNPHELEVVWPLKRRRVPRQSILTVRQLDAKTLKAEIGWGVRVGAGGLWGGFGWLWTRNRGIVQMYISRTDHFVWIERGDERPWLITPERPDEFIREISKNGSPVAQPAVSGYASQARQSWTATFAQA